MEENNENQDPKPTYEALELQVVQLTSAKQSVQERYERALSREVEADNAKEKVKEYLADNWDEIGETHATEIAEILGIEMVTTKTFEFTLKVTVEVTAESPAYDWDNFDGSEIDFEVSASVNSYSGNGIDSAYVEDTNVEDCEEA